MHGASKALLILHYLSPLSVFLGGSCTSITSLCGNPPKAKRAQRNDRLVFQFVTLILLTYLAEAGLCIIEAAARHQWFISEHDAFYVTSSCLIWSVVLKASVLHWSIYFVTCVVALIFEIPILTLFSAASSSNSVFAISRVSSATVRMLGLAFLCLLSLTVLRHVTSSPDISDRESRPLLNGSNAPQKPSSADYGTRGSDASIEINDSEIVDEEDVEIQKQQRKRIEEEGGWWGYIKGFSIFFPYLWPKNDRQTQLDIAVLLFCMIVTRFLKVLIPRQLGIITNALTSSYGTGHMPWQEVGLWILYQFLASSAGIRLLQGYSEARVEQFAYRSVSVAAFDHVLSLSMDFHNSKDTGEVLKAVDQGYALQDLLNTAFKFAPTTIDLTVAVFYVTYLFDIYMTFILIVVMLLYSWAGVASIDWYVPCRRVYVSKDRDEAKIRNEVISNWTTMTLFGQNAYERQRFGAAITAVTDAALKLYLWLNMGSAVQQLTMELGLFAISLLGAYRVAQGERAVGDFITLVSYWGTVSGPISFFVHTIRNVSSNFIDAERLLQLFNTKPTVTDIPGALPLQVTSGKVAFENVSFGYDDRKSILKNINFTAEVGKTVAFVGETGGGKSTILKLLFRLYDVGDGVITIDGQDIRRVTLQNLRSALGVVPQDPALFNQTIMENVRYGRLDASDEEVENACKAAAIHEKIMTFPDKYNTKVGERGVKLSGGELQRVALARVILRNPAVVILDEATSAVDSKTEASIQEELKKLSTGRTTMVVAHRLSTIKHADLILVIHDGQIVERGTHDELCALRGKYLQLWSKQASKSPSTGEEVTATIIEGETTSQLINV